MELFGIGNTGKQFLPDGPYHDKPAIMDEIFNPIGQYFIGRPIP